MTAMNARRAHTSRKHRRNHNAVLYGPSAEGRPTRIGDRPLPTSFKNLALPTPERGQRVLELLREHI